ncbi:MAG: pyridoxamine 5'-phosphate oxidase family protein [Bacteroidales bacterium]|nr:pyridoxamine 5'-phosphate oxidase family protein [Bacteroidales bacterium]MCF8406174.1 pyridoxamine 5'-phosphate oxidase family protein [Bacteroidales bacterium]
MKSRIITLQEEIERIIKKCDVCNLAMITNDLKPYVIPMNFGYSKGEIFFHCSSSGKKIDVLKKNNQVSVSFSTDHDLKWQSENVACSYSMRYKSVLAHGIVEFVEDYDEKIEALNHIMQNYTRRNFNYNKPAVVDIAIFKVVVEKFEGRALGY